jgi:predicted RNase H-like HicB family nuclease
MNRIGTKGSVIIEAGGAATSEAQSFCAIDELSRNEQFIAMVIKVILERGQDGYFVAHCPSLKSCWSQGKTREEALQNIREAIELYLEPDFNHSNLPADAEVVELS